MTVKEFVIEYERLMDNGATESEVDTFITKQFVHPMNGKQYVSVETKLSDCDRIVNNTYYRDNELTGKREFRVNSPFTYILFSMVLVSRYTSIEINFSAIAEQYDALVSRGLLCLILDLLPKSELDEYNTFLKMRESDLIRNEYEIGAYISNKFEVLSASAEKTLTPLAEKFGEYLENLDEKKVQNIVNNIQNNKFIQKLMK